jgi:hypothetical protein
MNEKLLIEELQKHIEMVAKIGKQLGYNKVTDKSKWREPIMAGKLGHKAFFKISAGKNSDKYGADAIDLKTGKMAEYKSKAIEDKEIRNFLEKVKNKKTNKKYSTLVLSGVYNGAYTHEAIDRYENIDHYFGVFHDETCVLIIRPDQNEVIGQLRAEVNKRLAKGAKNKTTNLNTVKINLGDKHLYKVVWKNKEWYNNNA